jgi:hypothetical protein
MQNLEYSSIINDINCGSNWSSTDDNCGASDNRHASFSVSEKHTSIYNKNVSNEDDIAINIYRYKFTDDFVSNLFQFSKIHQYDHRKDFKEAWNLWLEENDSIVSGEVRRLKELGYEGDVLDKMFKSARYYFRKKSTEKKEPVQRRNYVCVGKELLESMDEYIKSTIRNQDICKPSDSFNEFCKKNMDLLKESINILVKNGISDSTEIKNKIKKTYKNRYFMIISK